PRHPLLGLCSFRFFFNVPPTTAIYPLSLHDALPIYARRVRHEVFLHDDLERGEPRGRGERVAAVARRARARVGPRLGGGDRVGRSEEHTSELQSRRDLVCRLLLEKKKKEKHDAESLG